ncbi:MAG TPA: hypothetical protein VHX86_03795 [Tepidisphaeraceae bacterium]|jgi:hypothetical protein|nr:hypothetical protein [Tepidisphaeraceae bacterium]
MTLIVSAKFRGGVVVQADGRSNRHGKVVTDTLQKIFPIADSCLVVSHSGVNTWKKRSVAACLKKLSFANCQTHLEVAAVIDKGLGKLITGSWCECSECSGKKEGVEFLIDGFDGQGQLRRLFLAWPWNSRIPELSSWNTDWGYAFGQGKAVHWPDEPKNLEVGGIDEIVELVSRIHADAMTRTAHEVGGHIHSLKVTEAGSEWATPTAKKTIVLK